MARPRLPPFIVTPSTLGPALPARSLPARSPRFLPARSTLPPSGGDEGTHSAQPLRVAQAKPSGQPPAQGCRQMLAAVSQTSDGSAQPFIPGWQFIPPPPPP